MGMLPVETGGMREDQSLLEKAGCLIKSAALSGVPGVEAGWVVAGEAVTVVEVSVMMAIEHSGLCTTRSQIKAGNPGPLSANSAAQ